MPTLAERAEAIKARNRLLESVPGSGYHPTDTDFRGQLRAPQCRHLPNGQEPGSHPVPPISEHIVPFYDFDNHAVYFAGECAERAYAALQSYYEKWRTIDMAQFMMYTGTRRKLLALIPKFKVRDGLLAVHLTDWNDILSALYDEGIGLSGDMIEGPA
jgi:hypothetical protein